MKAFALTTIASLVLSAGLAYADGPVFTVPLSSDDKDSLRWDAPSNFSIYADGNWELSAKHLANKLSSATVVGEPGQHHRFVLNVQYFSGQAGKDGQCTGHVVRKANYVLAELDYKGELTPVVSQGVDQTFAQHLGEIKCIRPEIRR